jgi:hypothetical protein
MTWDLRYTSVESGPTGRSGFQFVATTPGTPPDVTRAVTPYMSYRPPPDAPSAPDPGQLARFPVAFAYGREGDHTVLVRCRYTGRDYSGRYGNFSGHAVVATAAEMEGLRPIELWASPVWSGPPGGTPDLVPGEVFDPDSLVTWLGDEGAHARLATLLDAVTSALAGGHGRVVLVSEDDGLIARWIALLSYSLPAGLAAAMSFTTYTAAPESAPQLVVGTVPGAWPGRAFHLDEPVMDPPDHDAPGRFARVVTECWRTGDLDGIDAVGELLTAATAPNGVWNPGVPGGVWDPGVRPDGAWAPGARPGDDTPWADQASGSAPRTPEGRWDTTSGTMTEPAGGKRRGARTRPAGVPDAADRMGGGARPTGPGGGPDAANETDDGARTRPGGATGVPDGTGGSARTRPAGVLDAADGAAALLALCRGDTSVSAEEEAAAAELVRRGGAPTWIWPSLAGSLPRLGFELAAALASAAPQIAEHCVSLALADPAFLDRMPAFRLRDGLPARFRTAVAEASGLDALAAVVRLADQVGGRIENEEVTAAAAACTRRGAGGIAEALRVTPGAWRDAMVSGVLAGLETAGAPIRRAMLDHDAVEALGDHDWRRAPRTGGLVLSARADRHEATAGLVELEPYGLPDIEELLARLWDAPPAPADCVRLIERLGSDLTRFATLRGLPRRVFETAPLDAEETVRLARLVRDRLPALGGPARIVLAHGEALRGEPEREVARVLGLLDSGDPLTARVCASVAEALTRRPARSRAGILVAASDTVRSGLADHWLDADLDKRARVDLAEIEVRLHHARKPVARLTEWGDGLGRFARRHVESALTDRDPELASAWRALRRRGA